MTDDRSFQYPDAQWSAMLAIVERAGGPEAKEKLNAQRGAVEKMVAGWQGRIAVWNGRSFGYDETVLYKRVENAARELKDALTELNFPAIFIGDDLVWKPLGDTGENEERFVRFLRAIEHVEAKAAMMGAPKRKQVNLVRDRFFGDLGRFWRVELGLQISASATSRFVAFVEIASEGVCDFSDGTARDTIANVVRKWRRRAAA